MGKSLPVSVVDQEKLGQWIAAHGTPQQVALRCRIVVEAAGGKSDLAMAKQLSVNRHTVNLLEEAFLGGRSGRSMGYCPRPGTETHV